MGILEKFTEKDMIEQMAILEDTKEAGRKELIPELFELLAAKKCEQATHEMIYHTLFSLMKGDEERIKEGIRHSSYRVQLLSIRCCRKSGMVSVNPELLELLSESDDTAVIGEIIMTLGAFKDPALIDTLCPYLFHPDPTILSRTMEALTGIENEEVRDILIDLINSDENLDSPERECNLATIMAVEHLGRMHDEKSRNFLLSHRNHTDPVFRKAIDKALQLL
ncbi:MAG: HEAT repeat domain-containing protein [Deltaproteobacteria bacterium]|nr:HEAT repeat domain-containing protein [Deltaproteobacteria bacterium]